MLRRLIRWIARAEIAEAIARHEAQTCLIVKLPSWSAFHTSLAELRRTGAYSYGNGRGAIASIEVGSSKTL